MLKNDIISIEIDDFTNCLVDKKTNQEFQTVVKSINPKKSDFKGWKFDWIKAKKESFNIYALYIKDSHEIQGMISTKIDSGGIYIGIAESAPHNFGNNGKYKGVGAHLFAIACNESKKHGGDFIFFDSKSNLIEYYKQALGAKQIGNTQRMVIEGESFEFLIEKYFLKGE